MISIRESALLNQFSKPTLKERKSVIGALQPFNLDIFRDKLWFPHEEMAACVNMYNTNSYAQSAINTMKDFIKGGDIVVKSHDKRTQRLAQEYLSNLGMDSWIDETIENTIKTGNAYLEIDFKDREWKEIDHVYPIADPSRIYINCDQYGFPKKKLVDEIDPVTGHVKQVYKRCEDEYYLQRVPDNFKTPGAQRFYLSYNSSRYYNFQIYAIPIHKRKIIHFRLNLSDSGIYGRSYIASALNDDEILRQIERSIAVIAKYKAVPRDIISYGNDDNPATDDEVNDFILYLESLEKDESAIINKPIKRESLAYAGQDINLEYMLNHTTKKIIAGIAPDFMLGMGGEIQKASAQIVLISYILSIYSKRKRFIKPIEDFFLKPFLRKNNLEKAWLEFGELDFETKSEKTNRIGAIWTQNLLTVNEARLQLGLNAIGPRGEMFYNEWQSALMNNQSTMNGITFPNLEAPPEEEIAKPLTTKPLPNGESPDKVFNHNTPDNKNLIMNGGKLPYDPYQKPTNTPKFLQKEPSKEQMTADQTINDLLTKEELTEDEHNQLISYFSDKEKNTKEEGILPYEWDYDPLTKKWRRVWVQSLEKEEVNKKK